ncbi:hemerythrin domain-containing protein [Mycobacterium sp. TY814]|nr:hemerythrin domain-containing protein [Mycobacterium sp. TY814]MDP7726217.1 hemerythrin domain-containing protein [Mycobacterium sp. TY814]
MTETRPDLGRRQLLGISFSAVGGVAVAACGSSQPMATPSSSPQPEEVTPPEDLMREHGVLKRVLLIYREGIRRVDAGDQLPAQELNASAEIIRSFIEDYHEHLEEQYVFPKLEQAGKLTDITAVLRTQHQRGRALTDRVLSATTGVSTDPARAALRNDLSAFIRMYEPHEAREDTVVFPALREVLPGKEFLDLAEMFEDEEHRRFGPAGFEGVVSKVADIENSLGIYDLSQFTPT